MTLSAPTTLEVAHTNGATQTIIPVTWTIYSCLKLTRGGSSGSAKTPELGKGELLHRLDHCATPPFSTISTQKTRALAEVLSLPCTSMASPSLRGDENQTTPHATPANRQNPLRFAYFLPRNPISLPNNPSPRPWKNLPAPEPKTTALDDGGDEDCLPTDVTVPATCFLSP